MNLVAYLRDNIAGAWQIMFGQANGLARVDVSLEGFWKSFGAVILVAPFAFLSLVSEQPLVSETGVAEPLTASLFALYSVALLADWFTFPLIFAVLAPAFGFGPRFVPFIAVRNWAAAPIAAMVAVVHVLHLVGVFSTGLMPYVLLVSIAVALRFSYVITRITLQVSMMMALPIVILDLLTSLLIWTAFDKVI